MNKPLLPKLSTATLGNNNSNLTLLSKTCDPLQTSERSADASDSENSQTPRMSSYVQLAGVSALNCWTQTTANITDKYSIDLHILQPKPNLMTRTMISIYEQTL